MCGLFPQGGMRMQRVLLGHLGWVAQVIRILKEGQEVEAYSLGELPELS